MAKRLSEYKRCKVCMELVADISDFQNCKHKASELSLNRRLSQPLAGKRGSPTLDIQEGNKGFWGDEG